MWCKDWARRRTFYFVLADVDERCRLDNVACEIQHHLDKWLLMSQEVKIFQGNVR
jgi:hypothetical protein